MTGLYALKAWFTRLLAPALKLAVRLKLSPNWLTLLGVGGAGLAAWALGLLHHGLWAAGLVALGLVIRLAGANLDGAVARARGLEGKTSGFWINEIGDRTSDLIVMYAMANLAQSYLQLDAVPILRWTAVATANLPTIVSVAGYFLIGKRINGGPVGKTERCALVAIAAVALTLGLLPSTVFRAFFWVIILGSVLTAVLRLFQISRLQKVA